MKVLLLARYVYDKKKGITNLDFAEKAFDSEEEAKKYCETVIKKENPDKKYGYFVIPASLEIKIDANNLRYLK